MACLSPVRPFPTDTPKRTTPWRRGVVRFAIDANNYGVDFGSDQGDTELAYSVTRRHVNDVVHAQWRNESGVWWIPGIGLLGYFVAAMSRADGLTQQYKVIPVYSDHIGDIRDASEVEPFAPVLDVARSGAFMVATLDASTAGVFLWDSATETFASTPVATLQPHGPTGGVRHIGIAPDSGTVIFGGQGGGVVAAYPVSVSGFGAVYPPPVTVPSGAGNGIDWHPSGNAVALSWIDNAVMSTAVWEWNSGWGAKYADPSEAFVGGSAFPRFSPDGETLFIMRVSPYSPEDAADGQYRLYEFDLASGLGARLAASGSPIPSAVGSNQSDYSGALIVPGSKAAAGIGFITYTFDGTTIGPGVANSFADDAFRSALFFKFSRDGSLLLTAGSDGLFTLFDVAPAGTLTQIGDVFTDPNLGTWHKLAWRDA